MSMLLAGWKVPSPAASMFAWAPIPPRYKDIGSLEVGKLADIIVIDGNPLLDIRVTEKVSHTMINGRLIDAATGDQLLPTPMKRGKFFWEN